MPLLYDEVQDRQDKFKTLADAFLTIQSQRQKQMEIEADKEYKKGLLDVQREQNYVSLNKNLYDAMNDKNKSIIEYAKLGMRPIDINKAQSDSGRLPSKLQTGSYGQAYVPSPDLVRGNIEAFKAKSDLVLQRQLAMAENQRAYKASEESPMTADTAGRYAFADASLRNIPKIENIMFGEDGGFRQDIATKLMYPWRYPKNKEVQDARRWITDLASARGLIQSGTVVKDNEWGRIMMGLGIDAFTDPVSMKNALSENKQFMLDFKRNIRPGSNKESAGPGEENLDNLFKGL